MFRITVKHNYTVNRYAFVGIRGDNVTIDPELLNEFEIDELVDHLIGVIWDLSPRNRTDAYEWLRERLEAKGIEVAGLQPEEDDDATT
jgi:hypothetical protein